MIAIKEWKRGEAPSKAWHVHILSREIMMAEESLAALGYIVTGEVNDKAGVMPKLRALTGAQIVDALLAYRDGRLASIESGLRAEVA